MASAQPSSSATSPHSIEFQRFKAKLEPLRRGAIGYVEGLQKASHKVISDIQLREEELLDVDSLYHKETEGVQFYAVSHKEKETPHDEIYNPSLSRELLQQAFFTSTCQKIVYCFLPLVRKVLQGDPAFDRADWKRMYVHPKRTFFGVEEDGDQTFQIVLEVHDYIDVRCKDGQRFLLDLSMDQFGFAEWFDRWADYRKRHLLESVIPPSSAGAEAHGITQVEQDDLRNRDLRAAIAQVFEEIKDEWSHRYGFTWDALGLLQSQQMDMALEDIIARVSAKVVEALDSAST